MKKILLLVLFLMFVPSVLARGFRRPTPTSIPTPVPTSSKFCINYGHQSVTYDLSGKVTTDLNRLMQSGVTCLRIYYGDFNYSPVESLAVFAKSKGFRVIVGGSWMTLTSDQLATYSTQVMQMASWAQTNHMDQFSLGNEQEYRLSGITNDQWVTFLTGLATQVKTVFSGKVSYETSGDFADLWATKNLGDIDLLGLNLYCGYACNLNYLNENITAHGINHVYISETNADMDTGLYNKDSVHAAEVSGDAVKLLSAGVPVYYFTYSACNENGVANHWGLYQCNVLKQPLTSGILNIK
jgi:hypothetical protein